MNVPFPVLYPRLIDPSWFNADERCDEDADLTRLEQEYKLALNSVPKQFDKPTPKSILKPVIIVEGGTYNVEDEVNEESGESGESPDDEEEMQMQYSSPSPPMRNDDVAPDSLEDITEPTDTDESEQSTVWSAQ